MVEHDEICGCTKMKMKNNGKWVFLYGILHSILRKITDIAFKNG